MRAARQKRQTDAIDSFMAIIRIPTGIEVTMTPYIVYLFRDMTIGKNRRFFLPQVYLAPPLRVTHF